MRSIIKFKAVHLFLFFFGIVIHTNNAQAFVQNDLDDFLWVLQEEPTIYPPPKEVQYTNIYHEISSSTGSNLQLVANNPYEIKAARIFNRLVAKSGFVEFPIVDKMTNNNNIVNVYIIFESKGESKEDKSNSYKIRFTKSEDNIVVHASGTDEKGVIHAAASLSQLVTSRNNKIVLREIRLFDYPDYSIRIFHGTPTPENIVDYLDWMLRYKMDCLALNSRKYSWWKVDEELKEIFALYKEWNDTYGGIELMQMYNLYEGKEIVISNTADIDSLKKVIEFGLKHGSTKLMLLADDTPPFRFGEGYILTDENDTKQFRHMAEAHCYLLDEIENFIKENGYQCELHYVPAFYTYEEMHHGDMELYINTPWEEQAFGPLKRDLDYIGKNMLENVFIHWCGAKVRSRKITDEELNEWTSNLSGRVPFLWDNTIYSHYPFTSSSMFTAYDNDFPKDLHIKTAGNGMFINGDVCLEVNRSSMMTVNDFLWNSSSYDPEASLHKSIELLYGSDNVDEILDYKRVELEIREKIGERELWYQADFLWKWIRKTRYTTQKNPFYYHLNYSRLKALRLQLKSSVPEPLPLAEFEQLIKNLVLKREKIINHFKTNQHLANALKQYSIKIDTNNFTK
jgi:hypothetical protein